MQKTVTFLEFDIKIENISVNQSPSQFLSQLYTCYQSCNSIYYQPEKNKNVYLEIFAPIKDKIEGKILKGRYPYRPDIIDASTHQKKNNPKGINDIEPQIGYFIFKIENINSTSIDGRALIQIRYSSYFKELFLGEDSRNFILTLRDREWICPVCKAEHDRDINASINLLKYGVTHLKSGRTGTVRTKACGEIKVSMNQEASQFIER